MKTLCTEGSLSAPHLLPLRLPQSIYKTAKEAADEYGVSLASGERWFKGRGDGRRVEIQPAAGQDGAC